MKKKYDGDAFAEALGAQVEAVFKKAKKADVSAFTDPGAGLPAAG